jgi:hypothetical protein
MAELMRVLRENIARGRHAASEGSVVIASPAVLTAVVGLILVAVILAVAASSRPRHTRSSHFAVLHIVIDVR